METRHKQLRWRLGVLAGVAMMLLALYPQLNLWAARGSDWNGEYAYIDTDEVAYSAYLNALIDGRPRRNDPYTGRDDRDGATQPESLFSIQFVPAYMIAVPARIFGLSTSTSFIALAIIAAFASSLTIFRLVWEVTGQERLAATAILFVLCLGTLAATHGEIRYLLGSDPAYDNLPFLRRYLPAVSLPFYFLLCTFVWRVLTGKDKRTARLMAVAAGLTFALLVFSYFYLWTSAAVLLICLALFLFIMRPVGWRPALSKLGIIGIFAAAALVAYFIMLSNRGPSMDKVQALTNSHAPDFFRGPEIIGLLALAALVIGGRYGIVKWKETATLFTASLALVPMVVFNQQIITGRSLQPIHYEQFIANYVSLIAVVLTAALLLRGRADEERKIPGLALICVALVAFGWGWLEVRASRQIFLDHNRLRDEAVPAIMRLKELARNSSGGPAGYPIVFSSDDILSESLPTHSPLGVLWTRHMHVFSGVTWEENKERFFQQLYYLGIEDQRFSELARGEFQFVLALFGWERANDNLTVNRRPVTEAEINQEVRNYSQYIASYSRERAAYPQLSYVVTPFEGVPNFTNLDRWYERDAGERVGKYMLYRLTLRP